MRPPRLPALVICLFTGLWTSGLWTLAGAAPAAEPGSAADRLVARSVAFHDPDGLWGNAVLHLHIEESRPDGSVRETELRLDPGRGRFGWRRQQDGREAEGSLGPDGCHLALDGSPEFSPEEGEPFRLSCEGLELWRDYYGYLWGLPMKLRDPGVEIDPEVTEVDFAGRPALEIRVAYREPVGSDVWYFYFAPETAALVGYRFYHDEEVGDGEVITLEGETRVGRLRLPASRSWRTHQGDRYLGTDTLTEGRVGR